MGRRRGMDDRTGVPDHMEDDQESETEVTIQLRTDQEQEGHLQSHAAAAVEDMNQRFYDADQPEGEAARTREETVSNTRDRITPNLSGEEMRHQQLQTFMQSTFDLMTKTMGTMQDQITGTMNSVHTVMQDIKNMNSNNSQAAVAIEPRHGNNHTSDQEIASSHNRDTA